MSAQATYLGWDLLEHRQGCTRPVWTVDLRTETTYRPRHGGAEHSCPAVECGHSDRAEVTTVRIVCSSCGAAHLFKGDPEHTRQKSTAALGYGQPPRRVAGLWLWPDAPLLHGWGNGADEEPWGYLVTAKRVDRVDETNVVGQIGQSRGARGAVRWSASAVPSKTGRYGVGPVRWSEATDGLRSVAAAAKWIAALVTATGGESL